MPLTILVLGAIADVDQFSVFVVMGSNGNSYFYSFMYRGGVIVFGQPSRFFRFSVRR